MNGQKKTTDTDIQIGSRIMVLRKAKGLSQTGLGRAIGVTFQQVQKYEKGQNRVGAGRMQAVAEVLGVPVADLYGDGVTTGDGSIMPFDLLRLDGASQLLQAYAALPPQGRHGLLTAVRGLAVAFRQPELAS